jgi:hypothetical protein
VTDPSAPAPDPPPSGAALGPLAAVALVGGILALAVGSIAMVFGATGFFCPLAAIGLILLAQVVVAKLLGVPVKGPESPMGVTPDELD